ncbi:hypothetical protein SRM_02309 [Salinibacter ruber M8]|uniref:Uncharacterized protein n=1 Tax=Salinibacter ruber (strain M8) TaxID=761659 RepID=D5HB25_SALRM|nr:hypothetical protein SRM_02309 [Salinibacter ruber M8]
MTEGPTQTIFSGSYHVASYLAGFAGCRVRETACDRFLIFLGFISHHPRHPPGLDAHWYFSASLSPCADESFGTIQSL